MQQPHLRETMIGLVAEVLRHQPGNYALVEIVERFGEAWFMREGAPLEMVAVRLWHHLAQQDPSLGPEGVLRLLKNCYGIWQEALEPEQFWFESHNLEKKPIEILTRSQKKIILKPYGGSRYLIFEKEGDFPLGWALIAHSEARNIVRFYVHIHDLEDTRCGIGHAITAYSIGLLCRRTGEAGRIITYFPATMAHAALFYACLRENILHDIEFACHATICVTEVDNWNNDAVSYRDQGVLKPTPWIKADISKGITFPDHRSQEHVFIRGKIPSASSPADERRQKVFSRTQEENALLGIQYQADLEERFIEQGVNECLGAMEYIHGKAKQGEIPLAIASVLSLLYIVEYARDVIGSARRDRFVQSEQFRGLGLENLTGIFEKEKRDEIIETIVEGLQQRGGSVSWFQQEIDRAEKVLRLDKEGRARKRTQVIQETKDIYGLIGSSLDLSRQGLVDKLLNHSEFPLNEPDKATIHLVAFDMGSPCPKNCRHCAVLLKRDQRLTQLQIQGFLGFANGTRTKDILCTGGEPFADLENLIYLIRDSNVSRIGITTNASFAVDAHKGGVTDSVIRQIWDAFRQKGNHQWQLWIQVSMDSFHQEIARGREDDCLRENAPLKNIANLMEVIFRY
jgi:hypothetical protein